MTTFLLMFNSSPYGICNFIESLGPACSNSLVYLVNRHLLGTCLAPGSVQGAKDAKVKRLIPFCGGPIDLVGKKHRNKKYNISMLVQWKHRECSRGIKSVTKSEGQEALMKQL